MQTKIKKIIYLLLIIYLLFNIFAYIRFLLIKVDYSDLPLFKSSLTEAAARGESFTFGEITDFEWDLLYIFPPYTPRSAMEEEIGKKWSASRTFLGYQVERRTEILSQDDSLMALAFVREGRVTAYILWSREDGDLLSLVERSPLTPETEVSFASK